MAKAESPLRLSQPPDLFGRAARRPTRSSSTRRCATRTTSSRSSSPASAQTRRRTPACSSPGALHVGQRRPEPVLLLHRRRRLRLLHMTLCGDKPYTRPHFARLPARPPARTSCTSSTRSSWATTSHGDAPASCPTRRSSTRCTSSSRSATTTARWCGRSENELCLEASPRRCHECFPEISPQEFFLRKRFIQSHFEHVDLFLAPSRFLLERYVDWGIPREKIRFEDYGRRPAPRVPARTADAASATGSASSASSTPSRASTCCCAR